VRATSVGAAAEAEPGRRARTFIEDARRAQIVAAAIETIAELGYRQASFAQIARRAGLSSTGLISYHFAGKAELMQAVAGQVIGLIAADMTERMRPVAGPAQALETYVRASIGFIAAHRREMTALLEILLNGALDYGPDAELVTLTPVSEILRAGQAAGEFREFDSRVLATVIQRSIDAVPLLLATYPDLDLASYADELVTTFRLATARQPADGAAR
jgi:AcrR family transcriptional regulator